MAELEKYYRKSPDAKTSRRVQIVMLRSQGLDLKQVASVTHCGTATVTRLCKNYRERGIDGLITTRHTSHYRYMTFEEETEFLEEFREKAALGQLVTAKEMHLAYQERIGRTTTASGFHYLLRRHDWRKVMPRPHHPKQADSETIVSAKKLTPKFKL
ncbi:helix-turn-helix domain-containing protein [Lactiplantibacillus argentoratensis]|uniref:helix-turn-helix domain-containing protein n=1 Tax=Lactiplantibacillus argentoratensis TaxID=271881 RepID=UPI001BDD1205